MLSIRCTAGFLLLVMLATAFGPLAVTQAMQPGSMHCRRQPIAGTLSGHAARPVMPCHGAAMAAAQPESSTPSLQAADQNCCPNHCCCGASTSQWAHPAGARQSFLVLRVAAARPIQNAVPHSSPVARQDSARAPPRS